MNNLTLPEGKHKLTANISQKKESEELMKPKTHATLQNQSNISSKT